MEINQDLVSRFNYTIQTLRELLKRVNTHLINKRSVVSIQDIKDVLNSVYELYVPLVFSIEEWDTLINYLTPKLYISYSEYNKYIDLKPIIAYINDVNLLDVLIDSELALKYERNIFAIKRALKRNNSDSYL